MKHSNRIKNFEERLERVIEDPQKILQIINKIIYMATEPNVSEEDKVPYWQFVKYFGNMHLENTLQDEQHQSEAREFVNDIEQRVKNVNGFSTYDLPDGLEIKYK